MPRPVKTRKKPGLSPGSLVYTREKLQDHTSLQLIRYNEQEHDTFDEKSLEALVRKLDKTKVNWINLNGLHDTDQIEKLGLHFDIHPLVLEDILHTEHIPKLENYDNYLFLTLKMLTYNDSHESIEQEHVSMILGKNFLITFQEKDGDVFGAIRENLQMNKGRLRKRSADYLFYRLLDAIVDHYYLITDKIEGRLESIEEMLLGNDPDGVSEKILAEKKKLILLRRSILPLREESRKFRQKEFLLIQSGTYSFLDDVFDHLMHLSQTLEGFRDLIASLIELQMSVNSNKMNNVMKTLTIFAAIFMPLTFIAGIYGMNFHYMPELAWNWGYPVVMIVMFLVAGFMLLYMKRHKWL